MTVTPETRPDDLPEFLTPEETATWLRLPTGVVYAAIADGDIVTTDLLSAVDVVALLHDLGLR